VQATGSYEVPFGISAALLAVGVVASLFIDPTRRLAAQGEPSGVEIAPATVQLR